MGKENTIEINGNQLLFDSGETILEVAQRNNIFIPTLCHLKGATPTGSCRICVVEVEGARSLVASCAAPAARNMVVHTESPEVIRARRTIISLMLSSGNHNCAIRDFDTKDWTQFQLRVLEEDGNNDLCPAWGDCKLQDLAYRYQVKTKGLPLSECKYPIEKVNPFIIRDFSRCILCGRCVQACSEIQVNNAIDFGHRGANTKIIAGADVPLKDSDCVFCGQCVEVCPVGALTATGDLEIQRFAKTKKVRNTCTFCGVGCQVEMTVQNNKIVKINSAGEDVAPNHGRLCVKGRYGFAFVGSPERITVPMIRKNGKLEGVTWDEALDLVASKFTEIKNEFGSDSLGVFTSARITNEENYIAQKFTRAVLKTNNVDHCARL